MDSSETSMAQAAPTGRFDTIQLARLIFAILGIIGLLLAYEGLHLKYYDRFGPGAGFFPVWLGAALAVFGFAGLVQSFYGEHTARVPVVDDPRFGWHVAAILLSLIALWFAIDYLGFRVPVLLYMLFAPRLISRMPLVISVPSAILASYGVGYIFESVLLVRLPGPKPDLLATLGFF